MLDLPHGSIPLDIVIAVGIVVVYVGGFMVLYGVVALRDRIYTRGLFSRGVEKYHIIDSQSFSK